MAEHDHPATPGKAGEPTVPRALPGEFVAALDRVLARLDAENWPAALALAELPDQIRGYEDLKLERIARYRRALTVVESGFND